MVFCHKPHSRRFNSIFPALLILAFLTTTHHAAASGLETATAEPAAVGGVGECHLTGEAAVEWPVAVKDGSGAAVKGARVRLACGSELVAAETGGEGEARLRVVPGSWRLTVEASGFATEERTVAVTSAGAGGTAVALRVAGTASTVEVRAEEGFAAGSSEAGLKLSIPLAETPQAITVVTRELMDSEGAVKLDDALRNVAGVMAGGYYDGWDYYRIRGFDASFNTFIDGLRGGNGMMEETWGLESVEVLKGPSSALYGESVLGGLVNIVTRKPIPTRFAKAQFTEGSYKFTDPAVDLGGPLNRSHNLYGRVAALYHSGDTFVDYTYRHRYYVAPSATWRPAAATSVTLMARFQRDNGRQAMPLPAVGTVLPNVNGKIAISRYIGELDNHSNTLGQATQQVGYQLHHGFNEHLTLNQNARLAWYQQNWARIYYPAYLGSDERTLYRYPLDWNGPWQAHAIDTNLEGRGKALGMEHVALVGVDFFRNPSSAKGYSIDFSNASAYEPLDLFKPVYGANAVQTMKLYTESETVTQYTGFYVQDHVALKRHVTVTGGGRLDLAKNESKGTANQNGRGWTPRVGVTWQPVKATALYASFSKSYMPQSGMVYDGTTSGAFLAPERGQQWEAGTKNQWWNGRATATLAVFQLNRKNVATSDPTHANFYLTTGEQRSRGVELETALNPLPGWNVTAAYSYVNAEVVRDTTLTAGTPTLNAPKNIFNVWTTYEVRNGAARGLGFGLGGRHFTDQSGDLANSFQLPGYGLMDASATYRRGHAEWRVNASNVTDERYASGSYNNIYVKPGEPRTIRGTVSWNF